ncbi:DNA-binding response regulator [Planctomycetota bacterium]|nr:DNA-binding response regulator [Planctomycetota bacterium]
MTAAEPVILVVEDEAPIRRFVVAGLRAHGFAAVEAATATAAMLAATSRRPDGILLDLGLPDRGGLELLRDLRGWYDRPIIILSALGHEDDKVAGLDAGADDYLAKPFGIPELLARLRAALRRITRDQQPEPVLACGDLVLDLVAHRCTCAGREVHLTPLEFQLLAELLRHAGRLVTHRQLIAAGWGAQASSESAGLRLVVHQLRRKIEDDPADPRRLHTEVGVGYRLTAPTPPASG